MESEFLSPTWSYTGLPPICFLETPRTSVFYFIPPHPPVKCVFQPYVHLLRDSGFSRPLLHLCLQVWLDRCLYPWQSKNNVTGQKESGASTDWQWRAKQHGALSCGPGFRSTNERLPSDISQMDHISGGEIFHSKVTGLLIKHVTTLSVEFVRNSGGVSGLEGQCQIVDY